MLNVNHQKYQTYQKASKHKQFVQILKMNKFIRYLMAFNGNRQQSTRDSANLDRFSEIHTKPKIQ